eukprot:3188934-Pyramimonas_sp.AAC.1
MLTTVRAAIQSNAACNAAYADEDALERQRAPRYLRTQPALCCSSEAECPSRISYSAGEDSTLPKEKDQRYWSGWLTAASRHKPFHINK